VHLVEIDVVGPEPPQACFTGGDDPISFGPGPVRKVPFVEISTLSRRPSIARPSTSSARPAEYTSALSNMTTPASIATSISRLAPLASVSPQCLKNSVPPPNVPVPRLRTGTCNPDRPSCLNSTVTPPGSSDVFGLEALKPSGP
jgi:hypothetical protein